MQIRINVARILIFLKKPGVIYILLFQIMLLFSAVGKITAYTELMNLSASFAYLFLILGVVQQMVSIRRGNDNKP